MGTIVSDKCVTQNFRVKLNAEDGSHMLFQNVDKHQQGYKASQITTPQSEQKL